MPGTTVVQKLNRCCPQSGGNLIAEKALFFVLFLGQQKKNIIDYAYTLQGWLKGINSTAVGDGAFDMGEDGNTGSANKYVARDAFGFSLNYYAGDYASININPFAAISNSFPVDATDSKATGKDLFNGNIRGMLVNIPKLGDAHVYGYRYDQLNRIVAMNSFTGLSSNTFTAAATDNYRERISYDGNGNILTYLRNGDAARLSMDEMTYTYKSNTNRLDKVVDVAADELTNYAKYNDIKQGQTNGNYQYDEIGNLISDVSEGITNIEWNVYGKIKSITKTTGTINYSYDASGNRISKTYNGKTTWYVRDASGNVMSVYVKDAAINDGDLTQSEVHLYGSSRLGILNTELNVENIPVAQLVRIFKRGNKFFELSNHLGNVLVTVSDKKLGIPGGPNGTVLGYEADVVSANDYYPGGMDMPGRQYNATTGYRYGFNGKEKDNKDGVVQYDYGFRIYDPRLVRFKSIDPLTAKYPQLTPYQFASNRPIDGIDLDGLEYLSFHSSMYRMEDLTSTNLNTNVTTSSTVVKVVYANVPTLLQNPQNQSFKFVGTGPVTTMGRDYDPSKDGAAFLPAGMYWQKAERFYSLPDDVDSPEPTASANGMGGGAINQGRADAANAIAGALGEQGAGVVKNIYNYFFNDVQGAINDEYSLKQGFYKATNLVDKYINKNLVVGAPLNRTDVVNFLTDGYLRTDFADNLKNEFTSNGIYADYSVMRKNIYGNALSTAWAGVQIMQNNGITIQDKTKQAITDLLSKYKANGGGNEFDNISDFY